MKLKIYIRCHINHGSEVNRSRDTCLPIILSNESRAQSWWNKEGAMATSSINSAAQGGSRPVVNGTGHQQRSGDLAGGSGQVGGFSSQNLNGIVSTMIFLKSSMI